MAQYNIPSSPPVYRSRYTGFVGCDFNTDPMSTDDRHFPYAQNLMLDTHGYPEKRPGFKEMFSFGGKVIRHFRAVISGDTILLVHAGNRIAVYSVQADNILSEPLASETEIKSCFFVAWNDKVYVYGTDTSDSGFVKKLEKADGKYVFSDAVPDAYIPETSIAGNVLTDEAYDMMKARGEVSAGGQLYEAVNLLGQMRTNTFKLSDYELVSEYWYSSDVTEGTKFSQAMHCVTDAPFVAPSEELKSFLLGFYLRLFCVDPSSKEGVTSMNNFYTDPWQFVYGDSWQSEYTAFVESVVPSNGTTVEAQLKSLPHGYYLDNYADALFEYVNNFNGSLLSAKAYRNPKDNWLIYSLTKESGMYAEVFCEDIGWMPLPAFGCGNTAANTNNTNSKSCFQLFSDFGAFLNFDEFKNAVYSSFEQIRYLRTGYIPYQGAVSTLVPVNFLPDKNADVNIRITYTVSSEKLQEGLKKVVSSDVARLYGVGGAADRVFVKGVGDEKHYVRFSEMENPLYFPDLNYITLGAPATGIVDMFPFSSYLCIAKEQNFQDVSFFLVEGTMSDGEAAFLVKEGIPGVGLKNQGAFSLVDDVPHFLSDGGVLYLTSVDITAKTALKNCSYFADPKILTENFAGARLFCFKKNLLLSFPESRRVYVFNTNDKAYSKFAGSDHYVYETWLWTDIEASDFISFSDTLYFVTKDGVLMRFKDTGSVDCYSDEYGGVHHPIDAFFVTKAFDDGAFMTLKNMKKRGCGIALKPFVSSSAYVSVITDRDEKELKSVSADIFDWTYINFERFEFTANPAIRIMPFNTKVKKYSTMQFCVRNNIEGESFGVIGIEKAYTFGNYKKN